MKKRGLGKGLDAIFAENAAEGAEAPINIKIGDIEPNREQPRKEFNHEALSELADSISQHGVLQPILLRPMLSGEYRIVAGERRWRASRMAGLIEIPAIVREMTDSQEMLFALIENLQREDLNPVEEARGYQTLMESRSLTQEEVSQAVGKSRPAIANALRLLNLPEKVLDMLTSGEISAGHARAILSLRDEEAMMLAANRAKEGASVREIEKFAQLANKEKQNKKETKLKNRQYYEETQLALNSYLNRKIKISGNDKKGIIEIEFYGEDDLNNLVSEFKLK